MTPSSARFSAASERTSPRGLQRQPRALLARLVQSIVPVLKQRTPLSAQRAAAFKNSQWRRDLNQSALRSGTAASRGGARRALVQSTWTRTERAKLLTTHAKSRSLSHSVLLSFNLARICVCVRVCARVSGISRGTGKTKLERRERRVRRGMPTRRGSPRLSFFRSLATGANGPDGGESFRTSVFSLRAALLWPNKVRVALS